MQRLTLDYIQNEVADTNIIYKRGERLFEYGACVGHRLDPENGCYEYFVDGNYGDYTIQIKFSGDTIETYCDCPYPGAGCKHTVAALLDISQNIEFKTHPDQPLPASEEPAAPYLSREEIRGQAIEDRKKRAKSENLQITVGDMFKGEHLVETPAGKQYTVTLHDPENGIGHCSCPDFETNRLQTCKHLIAVHRLIREQKGFKHKAAREAFPFVDIFWDAAAERPRVFCENPENEPEEIRAAIDAYFDKDGLFREPDLSAFTPLLDLPDRFKRVRIAPAVFQKLDAYWADRQLAELAERAEPDFSVIKTRLYPYQEEGIRFVLFKKAALIGDEMGLGKTLQAIAASILKKEIFGFSKVLVVTLASLKEQWKREIDRFSDEKAVIIAGSKASRRQIYETDDALFKITNYEAVLRDVGEISRFKPDIVILDEAQRIKNFNTKTADAVKSLPRKHAMVLTGTPLENKLEDVYSIVQFLDPDRLSPLWAFAAEHFMLSRQKKGKILGYRNLDKLHQALQSIVIRRKKLDVLDQLPDEIVNNYYIELTDQQHKIHGGYAQSLLPLMNKKFLTPMDLRRIQELLLKMRQVCNSTYLIDRKTQISPKLKELESILADLAIQEGRKIVIFSEWTTMTYLIARHLSNAGIAFVELSGKIPVNRRQALIDEFTNNPDCRVFLSTDAGGTGLNLQAADCVINFELPWNPARMNQRIGRVSRIGQASGTVNVINLIAKNSIEEKIYAGIQLKTDLFQGVFDGTTDRVEFSREKRTEMMNRLREMMQEEPEPVAPEPAAGEEIPEDTPHYLNPEVFKEQEMPFAYDAEETGGADSGEIGANDAFAQPEPSATADGASSDDSASAVWANQPPEKMEAVLNSGMAFIGELLEMATGQKIETGAASDKMVRIDKETGEVTMKFKLPGF
ncbi:MAG TPA: SNF2-related protein [Desulfosalsimonadaceae bacterium]|nr:SNF2-related protein [Desulfosalsimonadaceae bacterium]